MGAASAGSASSQIGLNSTPNKVTNYFSPADPALVGLARGAVVGTSSITGLPSNNNSNNNSPNTNAASSNAISILAREQAAATSGSRTVPPGATGGGAVSAPGVGVGHAANGLPIGTTGSGLGSPENPIGGGRDNAGCGRR
jgi:hypothetical protein